MNYNLKEVLQQLNHPLAVTVENAIVPGTTKPLGQYMLKQQPQKLRTGQCARPYLSAVFRVTKGHLAVFTAQNILLRQNPAIEVLTSPFKVAAQPIEK